MKVIYRYLLAPLATLLYLSVMVHLFEKPRRLFKLRHERKRARPNPTGNWVWVHSSSGEFEYAKAIIRNIKALHPDLKILVTYTSPSYEPQIRAFPLVDHSEPLPLDLPGPLSELIQKFRPISLLIARTDLWPELIWQCKRLKVKTALFALSFSKEMNILERLWKSWLMNQIDHLFLVSELDLLAAKDKLRLSTNMSVAGDPRFDQAIHRIDTGGTTQVQRSDAPVFIFGSSWTQDETVVLPALMDFVREKQLQLVIAPHEPSPARVLELQQLLRSNEISSQKLSDIQGDLPDVVIVDQVGVLAKLYTIADIAFVGGSFKGKVHSVMEALVGGCPTFVGPYHRNNPEAVKYQNVILHDGVSAVQVVHSTADVKEKLQAMLARQGSISIFKNQLNELTRKELGASQRIVTVLESENYLGGTHDQIHTHP